MKAILCVVPQNDKKCCFCFEYYYIFQCFYYIFLKDFWLISNTVKAIVFVYVGSPRHCQIFKTSLVFSSERRKLFLSLPTQESKINLKQWNTCNIMFCQNWNELAEMSKAATAAHRYKLVLQRKLKSSVIALFAS